MASSPRGSDPFYVVGITEPLPAEMLQTNVGSLVMVLPNWSIPVAVSCWVALWFSDVLDGATVMLVSVCATVVSAGTSAETPPRPRSPWHCAQANTVKS